MTINEGTKPKSANYRQGRTSAVKYIVIHYTANKGDTAANNVRYFSNNITKTSAHYFVDENSIYASVPEMDTAWHCGGGRQGRLGGAYLGKCTNANSIGIEMCLWDKNGRIRATVIDNTICLVKQLMKKYSVSPENVIRHWDVTGKMCPEPFCGDNNAYWREFKKNISEEIDMEELYKLQSSVAELTARIEDVTASVNTLKSRLDDKMIYNYVDTNMPDWARPTIQKLIGRGILNGYEDGLHLDDTMLRMLVILDRVNIFG